MSEKIFVDALIEEDTYVGTVAFPLATPERLVELFEFPEDVYKHAEQMGLEDTAVKFLMSILQGKWAITAAVNLQELAIKTGMKYPDMDRIVRDLIEKNYARLNDRLDLYRFWIALLHVKGVRFEVERD